jgi:hypothetical protein
MAMGKNNALSENILAGVKKAVDNMIEKSKKLDEEIVIARNGKVVKIKAKEL